MGADTTGSARAVNVTPVCGRISHVRPCRAQGVNGREARPTQPEVLREGHSVLMKLTQEEPHRRREDGRVCLRAYMMAAYALAHTSGGGSIVGGIEQRAAQLSQAKVEDMDLGVEFPLA